MIHVASYSKSFRTASRDVWGVIDEYGLENVLQDDTSVPVFRSACFGLSSIVSIVTTVTALLQKGTGSGSYLVLTTASFCVAFATISLCLQLLESALMATYLCFAEHSEGLREHYPITHHRLERITAFYDSS